MSDVSIALNRFGMGGRAEPPPGGEARRWLTAQLDRFDPRPAPIAALPRTTLIASQLATYLGEARMLAQQARREGGGRRGRAMQGEDAMRMRAPADATGGAMAEDAENPRDPAMQARRFARQQGRDHYMTAVGARAQAAVASDTPFVERLVHFWANHFAVSADKVTMIGLTGAFEFDAIRPHVLGSFRDMLHAVERHPAMLLYLDQAQSVGPNSPLGTAFARRQARRQIGLNENLAREILELHTLGVRTGYSQTDVTEFARAMTGWSVAGLGRGPAARMTGTEGEPGRFIFASRLHEPGARTILGKSYAQQGERQAAAVLDDLAVHPATAKHIATKLARHFAGDDPPATLVGKLEAAFLKSGGDLPTVYRALIDAPEAWVAQPVKFRTPWEWSISAMRALGTQEIPAQAVVGLMNQLGQPIWRPGSPAGYDDIAASWAGPDAVMRRVEAAERLAARTRETIDARVRAATLFPDALSATTQQAIARAESPAQGVALMLVSPEFLRR
ncbi:DUF1800 domain-containing protein [Sphingomonas sp. ST-64]|uniref:DUF1800 domain-containing protein n=1 Tax=Sphingomonas plantiphila TaxID=3163295 RepID=A0ABW8YM99_9SPHN